MSERIFLAFPSGYGACGAACRAVYAQSSRRRPVEVHEIQSSLLAHGFNILWCRLLNSLGDYGYFAMLHSDIGPDAWWADTLIDEMGAKGLDILSAVVPIKTNDGITSTGLDDPADRFRPRFRLSMREAYSLPETFTNADLGSADALLVNTGCWVARVGDWMRQVAFRVTDRIECLGGVYTPLVEPEDWAFSRQAHALGLRVGATRKVGLEHYAQGVGFHNRCAWGEMARDEMLRAV